MPLVGCFEDDTGVLGPPKFIFTSMKCNFFVLSSFVDHGMLSGLIL